MMYYVTHQFGGDKNNIEKAKKIVHDLQINDLANCYICPLLIFSHLNFGELNFDDEIELCLDVLSNCDKLIVAGEISKRVQTEIDFAHLVSMEVRYLDSRNTRRCT